MVPNAIAGVVAARLARVLRLLHLSGWYGEAAADGLLSKEEVRVLARDYGTEEAHGHIGSAATAQYLASARDKASSSGVLRAPVPPELTRRAVNEGVFWASAATPSRLFQASSRRKSGNGGGGTTTPLPPR